MSSLFRCSQHWKDYDVFGRQKLDTFKSSQRAVLELARRYQELIEQLKKNKPASMSEEDALKAEKLLFEEMAETCLWGNATGQCFLPSILLRLLTDVRFESFDDSHL